MRSVCMLNSCCCGCSLRTGSLLVSILDLLNALCLLIYSFVVVSGRQALYEYSGLPYTLAFVSSVAIIIDIVLLIGILVGRVRLLLPWLRYAYVTLLVNLVLSTWIGVNYIHRNDASIGYLIITYAILSLGFKVYFMMVIQSYAKILVGNYSNGVQATVYPSTLPQPYPNSQQPSYPNVNVQQTVYPNGQPPYTSGQQQMYPNGQHPFPNVQQTYPNSQVPGPGELPPPYPTGESQISPPAK